VGQSDAERSYLNNYGSNQLFYIHDMNLMPDYLFWTIESNNFICNLFMAVGIRPYVGEHEVLWGGFSMPNGGPR
jgi:hypothetical protein